MKDYNYNLEVTTNLAFFKSVFDDTTIKRYNHKSKEAVDSIKVPLYYGPKQRIIQDIKGKTDTIALPVASVAVNGMSRDNERVTNKNEDIVYKDEQGNFINLRAIPWNINVTLTILAKYQEDVDQIIQNFAVFCNPTVAFSWREPKSGRDVRSIVKWNDEITYNYPSKLEIDVPIA